jgi:hypothetical protein
VLAKHGVDQVREVETARAEAAIEATHAATERIAATVIDVTLLRILEHFVRLCDAFESLGRVRLLSDIRMQLHRKLAVRLLDLLS